MNKKILISTAAVSIAILSGALVLSRGNISALADKTRGPAPIPKVSFTKTHMSTPVYDSESYLYPTSFSTTISTGDPFASVDYDSALFDGTYLYGDDEDYDFTNPDNLFEVTGNWNYVNFTFKIHLLATIDLVHSFVYYNEKGATDDDYMATFEYDEKFEPIGDDYLYYTCQVDFYSDYGTTFEFKHIDLCWDC